MDEQFESTDEDHGSYSHTPVTTKPSLSGLTLVLPALSALKQQNGTKKSKSKITSGVHLADVGFGEVKKAPRPLKLKPLKDVLLKLISQIKKLFDISCRLQSLIVDNSAGKMITRSSSPRSTLPR
jgi:bromodomain-containing protein 7/9